MRTMLSLRDTLDSLVSALSLLSSTVIDLGEGRRSVRGESVYYEIDEETRRSVKVYLYPLIDLLPFEFEGLSGGGFSTQDIIREYIPEARGIRLDISPRWYYRAISFVVPGVIFY